MRGFRLACALVLVAGCVGSSGCLRMFGKPEPTPGTEPMAATTDEEAQETAARLEAVVRSGDRSLAMQEFALEVVAHRVTAGMPIAPDRLPSIIKVLPAKVDTNDVVDRLMSPLDVGGDFRLLRIRLIDDRHHATFRQCLIKGEVVYFDVVLARFPSGRTGVEEIVRLTDGQRLTDEVRREILPAAAFRDPGLEAKLSEEDRLVLANAAKLTELDKALKERKWKDVITQLKVLPDGLRDRKPARYQYAEALLHEGTKAEQAAALAALREQYPGDLANEHLAFNFHIGHNEFAEALKAVAALREAVGPDAALDAREALVLAVSGDPGPGLELAERAVKSDPDMNLGYLARIAVAVAARDHASTLVYLKLASQRTGFEFGDLRQNANYAEFVKSPEFQEWSAFQKKQKGG